MKLSKHAPYKDFRQGMPVEEIYKKYGIDEKTLISILNRNIKGNYDYHRILSSPKAHKQFLLHLKTRWNPLEPDAPWEDHSPYIPLKVPVKKDEQEEDND